MHEVWLFTEEQTPARDVDKAHVAEEGRMAPRMAEIQRGELSQMPGTRLESRSVEGTDSRLSPLHHLEIGERS